MKYLLEWPSDLRVRVTRAAEARHESLAVWIREAIRQRLEREASNGQVG
jgi:predicted transcriptional regulator